ncbi:hypothetical protein H4R34_000305 [Dimargaris verticillata]|uniref:Uncharacterized protein n=1 Tax=Dimargaris verticillata TaxID=2761393 RepID=A0A9W8EET3_9FUNG|nr:hypothetical protein H4R34_000305 [Dimargaris verticillata]
MGSNKGGDAVLATLFLTITALLYGDGMGKTLPASIDCVKTDVLFCSPSARDTWTTDEEAVVSWNPNHPDVAPQQSLNIYIFDLQNQSAPVHRWENLSPNQNVLTVIPKFEWFSDHARLYSAKAPIQRSFRMVPSLTTTWSSDTVARKYTVDLQVEADTIPPDPDASTSASASVLTVTADAPTPTPTLPEPQPNTSERGLSGGAIAGIAVSAAVVALALLLLAFFWRRRQRNQYKGQLLADDDHKGGSPVLPHNSSATMAGGAYASTKGQEAGASPRQTALSPLTPPSPAAHTGRLSVAPDDVTFTDVRLDRPQLPFGGVGDKGSMDSVHMSSTGADSQSPLASGSKRSLPSFSPVDAALIADAYRQKLREPAFEILPDDKLLLSAEHLPADDSPLDSEHRREEEIARRRQYADERMRRELEQEGNQIKSVSRGKTIVRHVKRQPSGSVDSVPNQPVAGPSSSPPLADPKDSAT